MVPSGLRCVSFDEHRSAYSLSKKMILSTTFEDNNRVSNLDNLEEQDPPRRWRRIYEKIDRDR